MMASKGDILQSFQGKHINWVRLLKNWRLPTQLIIFPHFWAKIIKIARSVNYSYLPPCNHLRLVASLFFNKLHVHLKCYILTKPCDNLKSGCKDMCNCLNFLNNLKHKNSSPLLTYNSNSILATFNSVPLIMPQTPFVAKRFLTIQGDWPLEYYIWNTFIESRR